jgi:hypothetical protein
MSNNPIYWKFDGYPDIYATEEWQLESVIQETKWNTGIPIWVDVELLKREDYELYHGIIKQDLNHQPSMASDSKPTELPKRTRTRKTKQTPI